MFRTGSAAAPRTITFVQAAFPPARAAGAAGSNLVKPLSPLVISGREVLPLVEGGKGISVSNGESSGAWAAAGGVGTFSGVNADSFDQRGESLPQIYHGKR